MLWIGCMEMILLYFFCFWFCFRNHDEVENGQLCKTDLSCYQVNFCCSENTLMPRFSFFCSYSGLLLSFCAINTNFSLQTFDNGGKVSSGEQVRRLAKHVCRWKWYIWLQNGTQPAVSKAYLHHLSELWPSCFLKSPKRACFYACFSDWSSVKKRADDQTLFLPDVLH